MSIPLNWHRIKLVVKAGHVLRARSTIGKILALVDYSHLTDSYPQHVCKPEARNFSFSPFLIHQYIMRILDLTYWLCICCYLAYSIKGWLLLCRQINSIETSHVFARTEYAQTLASVSGFSQKLTGMEKMSNGLMGRIKWTISFNKSPLKFNGTVINEIRYPNVTF